jgi:hypothetical protein
MNFDEDLPITSSDLDGLVEKLSWASDLDLAE